MKKLLVLALVAFFAMTGAAMAENYGAVKAGLYMPDEDGIDNGFNLDAAYGMEFSETLIGEFSLGYATADLEVGSDSLDVISLSAAALYPMELDMVDVRLGGGLGYYMAEVGSADDTEIGFFGQADCIYPLDDEMGLIGELKYSMIDELDVVTINVGVQFSL
ncbi:MAG: hypothetical protein C0618_03230 [Desulfuromonas sp.]|nr:MAG: hypothetical protein C0618_03230 [Desulfuromonas sp.]